MSAGAADESHESAGIRKVARGGLANLVGAGYSGVASFVITVLVARIATTEDAGIYFAAISILLMAVALAEVGVPVGYVYFLARLRGLGRTNELRPMLSAGGIPILILAVVLAAVAVLFRDQLGALLFGDTVSGTATIMVILASTLLIAIAADCSLAATRGLGTMRPTVVSDKIVNPTVQLLALLLLAAVGWTGGEDLIWTRVVGFVAVVIIGVPWFIKLLRRFHPSAGESFREEWMPSKATFNEFWRFTGPRAIGLIAQVGIQRVDIVLVALWVSPSEAAIYAAATRFLVFGQLAGNAIGTAVQPRVSHLAARGEMSALQTLYRTSTAWIILATWPFYLTFLVHAGWLMLVFGPEYRSGALVLQVLSAVMLVSTACGVVDAVLVMAGRSVLTMINAWVALVVNIGLNIWLIPEIGILGAAIAWAGAILATNVVPLVQVRVTLGVHPFGGITLLAALAAALLFGVAPYAVSLVSDNLVAAVVCLAGASVLYLLLLWRWRRRLGLTDLVRLRKRRT